MVKRVVTGAGIFVLMCIGIVFQGWVLRLMLLAAMLTAVNEMYRALRHTGAKPAAWTGYVYCVLAVGLQALSGAAQRDYSMAADSARGAGLVWLSRFVAAESFDPATVSLAVGLLLGLTVIVIRGKVAFDDLVATVLPMLYPGFLFSLLLTLQDLPNPALATAALMLSFFLASVNDVFALFVGVKFGRRRLSPQISPKKSVEGSVGGLAASVLFAVLIAWAMNALQGTDFVLPLFAEASERVMFPIPAFAALGLVAGALSQVGDLVASLVKRHCGIKDYGTMFPGHGGMMDRMDGVLFCTAACWLFFHLFAF